MSNRIKYFFRRCLRAIFVVAFIMGISFFLVRLPGGDVVDFLTGDQPVDPQYVTQLRHDLGLDRPLYEQFLIYARRLAVLDLGYSYRQQQPVLNLVLQRMPATLLLGASVLTFAIVAGVGLGIAAARRADKWQDVLVTGFALLGYASPSFWLGLMLVLVFAVWLPLLPPYGMTEIGAHYKGLAHIGDLALHLVLPTIALGTHYMGVFARITRASIVEVVQMDFVKAARAKGISERQVMWRHVVRNALLSVVTYTGVQAGNLVAGTVLVETVFAWPGLGRLIYESVLGRDYTLLLGAFFVLSLLVVLINLVVDLVYTYVDPRIEVA